MKVLIHTNLPADSTRGNRLTASRWQAILETLQHDVCVADAATLSTEQLGEYEILIALHALQSADCVANFRSEYPDRVCVVAITGTDIHRDYAAGGSTRSRVLHTLQLAHQIILLEPESRNVLPHELRTKTRVIFQSANPASAGESDLVNTDRFSVALVGHLREEKDPFLICDAVQQLPHHSRIQVIHIGGALNDEMRKSAELFSAKIDRYHWHGEVSHRDATLLISNADLLILTSRIEGAPGVLTEAIVNETNVLSTEIVGAVGLLGKDYPGLFPVGDSASLAQLLVRAEQDADFRSLLRQQILQRKANFSPQRELHAWDDFMRELT